MPRKLLVGNLTARTTKRALRGAFEIFGPLRGVTLVCDQETGRSRGFGFVTFERSADAAQALAALDGSLLDGRVMTIGEPEEAEPDSVELTRDENITIDDTGALFVGPGGGSLVIKLGQQRQPLASALVLVGRERGCDLRLSTTKASRQHAALFRFGRKYVLQDLCSRNGTTLNGVAARREVIRAGDVIGFAGEEAQVLPGILPAGELSPRACVMFLDVADFTSKAERHGAPFLEKLSEVLLTLEDRALLKHGCPIARLGDGMMLAFGLWPSSDRRHSPADSALEFARLALEFIPGELHDFFEGREGARVRFGIAYGEVCYRDESGFDVLGDVVNLASRLESLNKLYGTSILMSGTFHDQLRDRAYLRELDTVRVKGQRAPTELHAYDERLRLRETINTAVTELDGLEDPREGIAAYGEGLVAYRRGELRQALELFGVAADRYGDRPAACMKARVLELLERNGERAPDGWDAVWELKEK